MNYKKIFTKKYLIITSITVAATGLLVWFTVWTLSPRRGVVTAVSTSSVPLTSYSDKSLEGIYMRFNYSAKYTLKRQEPKNNDLEIYILNADTHYDKEIIASVSNLPDGQLTSYSAYTYRRLHSDLYTPRQAQIGDTPVEVWVKNDNTEQTVIIPHGNKVVTIDFLSKSHTDELSQEVDNLLSSFQWK